MPGHAIPSIAVVTDGLTLLTLVLFVLALVGAVVLFRRSTGDGEGVPTTSPDEGNTTGGAEANPPTDRDRVLDLLEENDGRMRQGRIVTETGWSKSKTSVLLSEMETEGTISKLRVGRENIVSLADREFDAAPGSTREA